MKKGWVILFNSMGHMQDLEERLFATHSLTNFILNKKDEKTRENMVCQIPKEKRGVTLDRTVYNSINFSIMFD